MKCSKLLKVAAVPAIAVGLLAGCQQTEQAETREQEPLTEPGAGTEAMGEGEALRAGEVAQNPESYYGRQVTVRAEVGDVISSQAFTLDEDLIGAEPDVLVLMPHAATVQDDKEVLVTGTLRRFVRAEIERDYEWFDSEMQITAELESRPVLIADTVRTADGAEIMGTAEGARAR